MPSSSSPSISSGVSATSTSFTMPGTPGLAGFFFSCPGMTYTWSVPSSVAWPMGAAFCSSTWYSWRGSLLSAPLRSCTLTSGVSMPEGSEEAMPDARPDTMPDAMPDAMPACMASSSSSSSPSSSLSSSSLSSSTTSISPHRACFSTSSSLSPSPTCCPNTSPYSGLPASSTGGLPQPPAWYPNCAPGGMGALRPGTRRLGYEGGGP
mmetsp:Transcript_33872/g.85743  ORF Transcript_33872/g.85743 Transcript_33872/m.85743 type:complete len:207 (-) Transcript_33872:1205-1825(-)